MAGQRFGVKDARDLKSYFFQYLLPAQSWRWRVAEKASEIHLGGYLLCLRLLPLRSRTRGVCLTDMGEAGTGRTEIRFDRRMGTKESSHSSVPILLSIWSGLFTEQRDAEGFSVDSVTQSNPSRKHRERMDNFFAEYNSFAAEYSNSSVEDNVSAAEYGNFFVEDTISAAKYGNFFVEDNISAAENGIFFAEDNISAAEDGNFFAEDNISAAKYGNFFVEDNISAAENGNFFAEDNISAAEDGNFFAEYLYFSKMYPVLRA